MSVLADFLLTDTSTIVDLFTQRLAAMIAPKQLTESELIDHLPDFLGEMVRSLRREEAGEPAAEVSPTAWRHGQQRLRVGYNLAMLVQEYGLLRHLIFDRIEAAGLRPSLREFRVLTGCLSVGVVDSVTRYVDGRQALLDGERLHLLGLFQQAPGFVCFLRGPEQVFELANAAYLQLVGHRDILGKTVRGALPEIEGQGYLELLDHVFRSGEPFVGRGMEISLQREPGGPLSEALLDFIYQPIRGVSGEVVGILAQGQDVTELRQQERQRRAAEAALSRSEERYQALFEAIDEGFCVIEILVDEGGDPVDYRFLETNPAFEGQTGLRHAVGRTARELVPGLESYWFEFYGRVAATGQAARFESHAPAMGRWFDAYASRVGAPEHRRVAVLFRDVSARKHAEQESERLLALESAARRQAEEASRLKDEFLATVSHELRTPLTSMLGWVQLLRTGSLAPEKRERALETVERNARAQAQLIEDLLDMSRILAGKLRLEVAPLEVDTVVEAALEIVRPAAEARSIRLQATLASGGVVMGDASRLQQIIWNLLSNAVKFTPRGGRVQVIVEGQDSAVEITVADTGRGIAPAFLPHVFERFRQEEGGSTRQYGGLGIGLSIVRQLVEMHGGTVTAFSEGEGRGASFTVRLPLSVARRTLDRSPTSPPPPSDLPCPPELDGLHLLLVDDEPDTRDMLRLMLEGCGAQVRLAGSVAEGLRLFEAEPPDVLVSDIGMPEENGYDLIRKIRALPPAAGGDTPAVALTAYARSEDRTRALIAGFTNHVAKPVEPLELLAVIASMARRRPTRREESPRR
jgi:signal transduction histidine kinase/CheY-like chemotaxis protein